MLHSMDSQIREQRQSPQRQPNSRQTTHSEGDHESRDPSLHPVAAQSLPTRTDDEMADRQAYKVLKSNTGQTRSHPREREARKLPSGLRPALSHHPERERPADTTNNQTPPLCYRPCWPYTAHVDARKRILSHPGHGSRKIHLQKLRDLQTVQNTNRAATYGTTAQVQSHPRITL